MEYLPGDIFTHLSPFLNNPYAFIVCKNTFKCKKYVYLTHEQKIIKLRFNLRRNITENEEKIDLYNNQITNNI